MIFFIWSYGNRVNVRKEESGFHILLYCRQILHATNLMKVWDLSFKQKYFLIKDDNVVVTFANEKLKVDVSNIARLFYESASFFKQIDWSNFDNDVIPKNFQSQCNRILTANLGEKINMLSKVCACQKLDFGDSSQTLFWLSSYILSFIRDRKNYKTVFLRMSVLPSLPESALLTFVIIWPVWLEISRHFLMPSKSSCFSFMEDFSNQLKI